MNTDKTGTDMKKSPLQSLSFALPLVLIVTMVAWGHDVVAAISDKPSRSIADREVRVVDSDDDGYGTRKDCDDSDASIHPERKDCRYLTSLVAVSETRGQPNVDDDCDGQIDEDWICVDLSSWQSGSVSEDSGNETETSVDDTRVFPTNSEATIKQIPFFHNSSLTSGVTPLADGRGHIHFSETGATAYFADENRWARIWPDYYRGRNGDHGLGSIVADPNSPDTFYGCFGHSNGSDEYTWMNTGNLIRFGTGDESGDMISAERIAGDKSEIEEWVFGCSYNVEYSDLPEEETGLDIWYVSSPADMIAFDPRETAEGYSRTIYFMTHILGPIRARLDDSGTTIESIEFLEEDLDPALNLFDTGTADYGYGLSDDDVWYDYGQEGEPNRIGAFIVVDPVHLADASDRGLSQEIVLYAGYFDNSLMTGGLQRLIIDENGNVESELWATHPETGLPIDARDIECFEDNAVAIDGTERRLAETCLVAAGADGVFVLRNNADGTMTLTDVAGTSEIVSNTIDETDGSIISRQHYVDLCGDTSSGCTDISSYFVTDVDIAEVDGVPYAVLTETRKVYLADVSDPDAIRWIELSTDFDSVAVGGFLDAENRRINYGGLAWLDFDAALAQDGSASWQSFEGFADRSGFDISVDPRDPNRVVSTDLDGTAAVTLRDDDFNIVSENYANAEDGIHSHEFGLCYGVTETDDTSGIAPGDEIYPDEITRYNSYGMKVLWAKTPDTGEWVGYIAANFYDGNDGAIHKLVWDDDRGNYRAELAVGLTECVNGYPYWNNTKTTCLHACEPNPEGRALPNGETASLAVTRDNADNLILVRYRDGISSLWRSVDGGANWDDISDKYVYGATGVSMAGLGQPTAIEAHPTDTGIFYASYGNDGVFKFDLDAGVATLISTVIDDGDPNDARMPRYQDRTHTTLGETIYKTPYIEDIAVAINPDTGYPEVHTAAYVFADVGWGRWPETEATAPNGGGDYVITDDGTFSPGVKLNFFADDTNPMQNFMAYKIAASADGKTVVLVGNAHDWSCQGNPPYTSGGILVYRDGAWSNPLDGDFAPVVKSVGLDPNDPNHFVVGMGGDGMWDVRLE